MFIGGGFHEFHPSLPPPPTLPPQLTHGNEVYQLVTVTYHNGHHFAGEFLLDGQRYRYDGMDAQCIRCVDHQDLLGMSVVGGVQAHIESFIYVKQSLLRVVGQVEEEGGGEGDRGGGMDWGWGGEGESDQPDREGENEIMGGVVGAPEGEGRTPGAVEEDEDDEWVDGPLDVQDTEEHIRAPMVAQDRAPQDSSVNDRVPLTSSKRRRRNVGTAQVEVRRQWKVQRQQHMEAAAREDFST